MTVENQLADRTRWRPELCSIAKTLDLLSTKATFLVLRECFYDVASQRGNKYLHNGCPPLSFVDACLHHHRQRPTRNPIQRHRDTSNLHPGLNGDTLRTNMSCTAATRSRGTDRLLPTAAGSNRPVTQLEDQCA
jgi:hypothetical protein